jgi:hypothetical protein
MKKSLQVAERSNECLLKCKRARRRSRYVWE